MHHCVNALHRPPEPVLVAHVPDEVAELGVVARWKALGHLVLLELVSGVDDHPGDPWVFVQDDFNELVPEGAGAAGDEDVLAGHATLLTHYFFRSQPNSLPFPAILQDLHRLAGQMLPPSTHRSLTEHASVASLFRSTVILTLLLYALRRLEPLK